MRNNTFQSLTVFVLIASFSLILLYSTGASAQVTAETTCYNQKLKASGKYVNCLLRAERQANRDGLEVSDEDVAHCHENFERRYTRAEAQAAEQDAQCPSHGGLAPYQHTVAGTSTTINSNNDVKLLAINIQPEDLEYIQSRFLNLNIAVKVNGVFNVVWRSVSAQRLTDTMEFQWSPVFQAFGAEEIEGMEGQEVEIDTNVVNIALGQDVVFGANEILATPIPGNNPNAVEFINGSEEPINPALGQLLTILGDVQAITSIFYNESPLLGAQSVTITPSQEIMIWFEKDTSTGDIFMIQPPELSTILDFTNETSVVLNFSNMQWSAPEFD